MASLTESGADNRPVIACIGNCQSGTVRALLLAVPEISRDYDVVFTRSRRAFAAVRPRVRLAIHQMTHAWDGFQLEEGDLPPGAALIRYPAALATWPWPTIPFHHRNKDVKADEGAFQMYPYTICDDIALRLIEGGVSRDRFVDAYFEVDVTRAYPLNRLREISAAKARQIDDRADFGIWDHIDRHGAEQQLFRTANHPNGPLMGFIMREILDRMTFLSDLPYARKLAAAWSKGVGIQPVEAPVHPQVAQHFGLTWAKDRKWTFWNEGDFTFEERLMRMYDFRFSRNYQAGSAAMNAGQFAEAAEFLRKAVRELPRSVPVRRLYAMALTRAGDVNSAAAVRRRIFTLEPTAVHADDYVGALNRARRAADARKFLDGLKPPLIDEPLVLLARSRAARALKQNEEADRLLAAATAGEPDHLQVLIERSRRAAAEGRSGEAVAHLERAHYVSNWSPSVARLLDAARAVPIPPAD